MKRKSRPQTHQWMLVAKAIVVRKSCGHCGCTGSIPVPGTNRIVQVEWSGFFLGGHEFTNLLPRMHEWGAFVQLVGLLHSPLDFRIQEEKAKQNE
jgi:hypothetical protein